MIAVDTNILLRVVVGDDPAQQATAARRIARLDATGEDVLVTTVALAEFAWSLRAVSKRSRHDIANAIERISQTPPLVLQSRAAVETALAWFRVGPADFADYLIVATSLADGARGVLTFDENLLKNSVCERP